MKNDVILNAKKRVGKTIWIGDFERTVIDSFDTEEHVYVTCSQLGDIHRKRYQAYTETGKQGLTIETYHDDDNVEILEVRISNLEN